MNASKYWGLKAVVFIDPTYNKFVYWVYREFIADRVKMFDIKLLDLIQ